MRASFFCYGEIRVIPSCIMAGGSILIEKSKAAMAAENIAIMAEFIK